MNFEGIEGKILPFPSNSENPNTQISVVHDTQALVYDLFGKNSPVIYYERDRHPMSSAREFFEILLSSGYVTIYFDGENQDNYTRLEVGPEENLYELSASEFITLTAVSPDHVSDRDRAIEQWLRSMNIRMGQKMDDQSTDERYLSFDEIGEYRVDTIVAYDDGFDYRVEYYNNEEESLGDMTGVDVYESQLINGTIYLLDIILLLRDQIGLHPDYNIDTKTTITYFEHEDASMLITHLTPDILEKVLTGALIRINPLYQNMSLEKAIEHYMKKYQK